MRQDNKIVTHAENVSERILVRAEALMRQKGYNAVSFREIAKDVGIKSASLHYYFPKKVDLGVDLVARYARNFSEQLLAGEKLPAIQKIELFIDLHRRALSQKDGLCLCAMFGAESQGLPDEITRAVRGFFEMNIIWLSGQYKQLAVTDNDARAKLGVAALEGALIMSIVNDDASIFETAAQMVALQGSTHIA